MSSAAVASKSLLVPTRLLSAVGGAELRLEEGRQRPGDSCVRLPSMTTDTEADSTKVAMLHEGLAAGHAQPEDQGRDSAPASPSFSVNSAGILAEPTFSLSSTDVSPDKSMSGLSLV